MDRGARARTAPAVETAAQSNAPAQAASEQEPLLDLQRVAGNAAVIELLGGDAHPGNCGPVSVQRDLAAYNEPYSQRIGMISIEHTVDSPALGRALAGLIAARRLKRAYEDNLTVFSAQAAGVTKAEIEAPLAAAGYTKAAAMADVLLESRDIKVYSGEKLLKVHPTFGDPETVKTEKDELVTPDARPLTAAERAAARAVFGGGLRIDGVLVSFGGPMSAFDTARTIPDHIYFPEGFVSMGWLIHELTHVWQYQEDVAAADVIQDAIFATYDYGGEHYLAEAWANGESFAHFNNEQQGDILQHYYERVVRDGGKFDSAVPFVEQVRNGTWRGPRDLEKERREREAKARQTTTPPVTGPAPDITPLLEQGLEGLISLQLGRRIRSDDIPALAERKRILLELFGRFSPPSAAVLLARIGARRPGDELVRLLYRRVSRGTRAEIVKDLTAIAPRK
jgi:hypothetical protein